MGLKAVLSRYFAAWVTRDLDRVRKNSVALQQKTFQYLIDKAKDTEFGRDHYFESISTYADLNEQVPIRDYEDLRPYIERVTHGEVDILWPGKPEYLAKTSGTTSGVKYIPITKESMPEHIKAARNALLNYIHETRQIRFCKWQNDIPAGQPGTG